jgi:Flp pilus assembly protein TadG
MQRLRYIPLETNAQVRLCVARCPTVENGVLSHPGGLIPITEPRKAVNRKSRPADLSDVKQRHGQSRRGTSLIYATIVLAVLMVILSLSVDYGRVLLVHMQLEHATEAAARRAVQGLGDGTWLSKAKAAALETEADGSPVILQNADVVTGNYNPSLTPAFSTSRSPANAVSVSAQRSVEVWLARPLGLQPLSVDATAIVTAGQSSGYGIVGITGIVLNSNIETDSYNSAAGAYNAATAGQQGHLASNSSISISSSTVEGKVYMLAGQSLNVSSSSHLGRVALSESLVFPTPSAGSYASSNNNASISPSNVIASGPRFQASGKTVTIPGGNYYFLSFDCDSSTVNVTGPATIYVNGPINVNSSTFNVLNNKPGNLAFRVTSASTTSISFNSVPSLAADIYAPTASINFNSVQPHFYGRIIGRYLNLNSNTQIHVDTSLPALPGASTPSGGASAKLVE